MIQLYPGYENFSDLDLLALCIFREVRGDSYDAKLAQACTVRNRVLHPTWWGHTYREVILEKWQYTSFDPSDPNSKVFPQDLHNSIDQQAWADCQEIAQLVLGEDCPDVSENATSYFDVSLDPVNGRPDRRPKWAKDGSQVHVKDVGHLHLYARSQDLQQNKPLSS